MIFYLSNQRRQNYLVEPHLLVENLFYHTHWPFDKALGYIVVARKVCETKGRKKSSMKHKVIGLSSLSVDCLYSVKTRFCFALSDPIKPGSKLGTRGCQTRNNGKIV